MPWITAVGVSLAPLTGGLFMIILKDPEQAQRLGLIGAKAQIIAALGWGAYFPWSIPALYSGVAGPSIQDLSAVCYLLVVLAGLSGLVGSFAWWQFADQT